MPFCQVADNCTVQSPQEDLISLAPAHGVNVAQPDVTLMLDMQGVIQDVALSNEVSNEPVDDWRGRPWVDTVGAIGSGKVLRMMEHARESGVSAFRQVTQRFPSGLELPMEYTIVRLGGKAGLIAIGRSLKAVAELQSRLIAAQQSMEQDYWKLREAETRYRILFDASNEAVLLLKADSLQVLEANPAAIRSLGLARGQSFHLDIAPEEQEALQTMLGRTRQNGRAPTTILHVGPDREQWTVRASMMTAEPGPMFMVQLTPVGSLTSGPPREEEASVEDLVDRLPDAFVVIDRDGVIRRANRAFLDLVEVGAEGAVIGEKLARWLSRPGADVPVLLSSLNRHGSVRMFATSVQGELGADIPVEVSAVGTASGRPSHVALVIRDVSRRLSANDNSASLQASFAAIIEQTGKTSLRTLVKEAVGLIERHYIAAALELSAGNRTVAAEILGLSRQGLYQKLAYYEMDRHSRQEAESVE